MLWWSAYLLAVRFAPPAAAALSVLFIASSPTLVDHTYLLSADVFNATLIVFGALALLSARPATAGALLGLAVWARPLTAVIAAPLAAAVLLSKKGPSEGPLDPARSSDSYALLIGARCCVSPLLWRCRSARRRSPTPSCLARRGVTSLRSHAGRRRARPACRQPPRVVQQYAGGRVPADVPGPRSRTGDERPAALLAVVGLVPLAPTTSSWPPRGRSRSPASSLATFAIATSTPASSSPGRCC